MITLQLSISDKHYHYLKRRAERKRQSLDLLVSELIDADLTWEELLASDPITELIGTIDDDFVTENIDEVVYRIRGS